LNSAYIGGNLDCAAASFDGNGKAAIYAQLSEISGDVILTDVTAKGTVALNSSRIGGQLICKGAMLSGMGSDALFAQGAEIDDSIFFTNFSAEGTVDLNGCCVAKQINFRGASLDGVGKTALKAQRLRAQSFLFWKVRNVRGKVNLNAAHLGDLADDMESWPVGSNQLILDGLTYDRLTGRAPTSLAARRGWLTAGSHWDGDFFPQPYTQLARVLRQIGHGAEARKVLIERQLNQGKATRKSLVIVPNGDVSVAFSSLLADVRRLIHCLLDWIARWVAGYGQDASRSLWWLLGLWFVATTLAHFTWAEGSFAPNSAVILASPGWAEVTARDCFPTGMEHCDRNPALTWSNTFTASADTPTRGADWDSFNRYGYAADLVVPFLDLGQTNAWAPSKDRGPWGWWLWWMRWVLAALGWIVTGLGVAAVTGVMQRNQPD
jgi:hypothetical protein